MKRYNLTYLKEISGNDEEFILDMIQTFISNSPDDIKELKDLANIKQWDTLGERAHKFAPGLQFLGIITMRPVINQIEDFSFGNKNLDQIPLLINRLNEECALVIEELKQDFNI